MMFLRDLRLFLHRVAILAVLGVAAGLRWMHPGLVEFKYDEAHILGIAQGIAAGRFWPVFSGGTSIGVQRSAFDAYILALALIPAPGSPQAAVIWLGMLGVLAVALTYLLGRLVAGRWTGLLAALYMAVNPWLVFYDRKFWAHIQVTFSVLLLLLAWRVVVDEDRRARFWFPVVAALQLLTHVLALVQVLSWLAAWLLAPRRWLRRQTLWGGLVGLALMSPYLWMLASRLASFPESAVSAWSQGSPASAAWSVLATRLSLAWQLWGGDRIFELAGVGAPVSAWDAMLLWVRWLALGMMFLGGTRVVLWLGNIRRRREAGLLLGWALGPVLALCLGPLSIYLQYWTVLLPLPALFLALGATWPLVLVRRMVVTRTWTPLLARGFAMAVALVLLIFWGGAYGDVLARIDAGAGIDTFGHPLRDWQAAADAAVTWATKLDVDQVKTPIFADIPEVSSTAAAVSDLLPHHLHPRFFYPKIDAPALLLHASEPSLYLVETSDMTPVLAQLGQEVWRGQGDDPLLLYLLPAAPKIELSTTLLPDRPVFDVGMALQAYAFPQPWPAGESVLATLVWRVTQPAPDVFVRDITAFNHILRQGSQDRAAQVDGLALLSRDWQPDDVLYQGYRIIIPEPGRYEWLAGLYSRSDGARAHLPDGGDGVRLPLLVTPP